MSNINIYDIAKMTGVSIATVSRVLNGSEKVSEKTRLKVMEAIKQSGYTPNVFARGLGMNTMQTVGIMVPSIADLYMSSAVAFLEDALHRIGYECILSCSGFKAEDKASHLQMLLTKRVDAMILVGSTYAGSGDESHNTDYIRTAAGEVPVFLINGLVEGDNIYCSATDDYQAVYDVTERIIRSGRKAPLFLTDSRSYSAVRKKQGFKNAMKAAGLKTPAKLSIHTTNDVTVVRELLHKRGEIDFDSVIATDDGMAIGAIKYAKDKGMRIPEDVCIVGYNNSALCCCTDPELASIDNHVEAVCHSTVDRLQRVLSGEQDVERLVMLDCSLVERETLV